MRVVFHKHQYDAQTPLILSRAVRREPKDPAAAMEIPN